jgi:arsenate reductase-like glutaredoxin family protein
MDRDATLGIARGARRFLIKTGADVVRLDTERAAVDEDTMARHLVHEDGFMRVPVLVRDDLLVRGYTEPLYREVFTDALRSS